MTSPFYVRKDRKGSGKWALYMRQPFRFIDWFPTSREAVTYAYKHWPWWP